MKSKTAEKAARKCGAIQSDMLEINAILKLMDERDGPNGGRVDYSTYELAASAASKMLEKVYDDIDALQSVLLKGAQS